jgi:hypothetical protein
MNTGAGDGQEPGLRLNRGQIQQQMEPLIATEIDGYRSFRFPVALVQERQQSPGIV